MKKLSFYLVLLSIVLSGCQTWHKATGFGVVESKQSKFDGAKEVSFSKAFARNEESSFYDFRISGYWRSNFPNSIILRPQTQNINWITGLKINVDGKIIEGVPVGYTQIDSEFVPSPDYWGGAIYDKSERAFIFPIEDIKALMTAEKAMIRLDVDGTYLESNYNFRYPGDMAFKDVLPEFMTKVSENL